ncbi:hypothetical protein [uncultured Sulfitobacter sp.]
MQVPLSDEIADGLRHAPHPQAAQHDDNGGIAPKARRIMTPCRSLGGT